MQKTLLALSLLALVTACGGHGGGADPQGQLVVIFTDAPLSYEFVSSATVEVDRIAIDAGPTGSGEPVIVYQGAPRDVELTALRNGCLLHFGDVELPVGSYSRLFVHLAGARLERTDGQTFSSHDGSLQLAPMAAQGVALDLLTPITLAGGDSVRLLFDFDLTRSFQPQGGADPLLATGYLLDPIVHAVRPGASGEIRGVVTHDDGTGQQVGVPRATIFFLPAGSEESTFAFATTSTDDDGSYVQLGLPPGSYDVRAAKSGVECSRPGIAVSQDEYAVVDLSIP